ncbi:hypothetical protein MKQ70_35005 [Chitinophaga sedimenti]|uniref:hypothetical protein n=1 Tax=Chitinophaga sedimenti TaxID=2033606 RepID=UPI002003698F|nr:hypothetical protein [Chitinophaga sedimenti]MCK7559869.1 hypothetical protein [Chitinophaga sedimenti]
MKMILLLVGLIAFGTLSVHAQQNGRQSTKYVLFPDYDRDIQKLNADKEKNARKAPENHQATRQQIFTNYNPQKTTPKRQIAAKRQGEDKLSSATVAPTKEQVDQMHKELKKPEIPTQGVDEPAASNCLPKDKKS